MKTLQKLSLLLLSILVFADCSSSDDNDNQTIDCTTVCSYTATSGQTAASVPATAHGTFDLTYQFASANSPFANGTTGTFSLSATTLVVNIDGEDCIKLENPVARGAENFLFIDNCRDNITYNVSTNTDGTFAEVNIEPIGTGFFGQFGQ